MPEDTSISRTDTSVSVSRRINASPESIFAVLTDPSLHPVIDGSGTVRGTQVSRNSRLALGSKFGMKMRLGLPYRITSTVVEFDEGRLIAWQHLGGHRWRYELEPCSEGTGEDDCTVVTETFDWSTSKSKAYITGLKWPDRHIPNIRRTLERLDALVVNRRQPI
jgi:uncharacterized protein YndB with AHSA1/START domain